MNAVRLFSLCLRGCEQLGVEGETYKLVFYPISSGIFMSGTPNSCVFSHDPEAYFVGDKRTLVFLLTQNEML